MRRRKLQDQRMPLMEHIKALRKVIVVAAYALAIGTIVGWVVADSVYAYLAQPIVKLNGIQFITTTPMEPVLVKLKVSWVVGLLLALPVILWKIWGFVLPALKQNERKYLYLIVPSSFLLFLGGAAFSFFIVIPVCIKFLVFVGGNAVQSIPFLTKTSYLNFIITFLLTFGLIFQLPIILLIIIKVGLVTPRALAKKRRYALFTIIILAVLVSPTPDLFTQLLMVVPMYFLYEISIWLGYLVTRKQLAAETLQEAKQ